MAGTEGIFPADCVDCHADFADWLKDDEVELALYRTGRRPGLASLRVANLQAGNLEARSLILPRVLYGCSTGGTRRAPVEESGKIFLVLVLSLLIL